MERIREKDKKEQKAALEEYKKKAEDQVERQKVEMQETIYKFKTEFLFAVKF